ncbi:acetyl ornithine aminotransferase family protein [Candidatus Bathyarchaeota archaeon]|nr:acetyl ornithine aminotransferase family protein [Candidatus Bathyarchaeota archaeon]MCK4482266.1 acetyl ornithine aminotransferase family protein [Candidatus Bathyarchaeota archaeon]
MSVYPKIVVTPPGPKARELVKKDEQVISPSYGRFYPLVVESGRGCIVRDVDGNEYIDFNSGLVCLNVGHNHPKVVAAIKNQCDRFLHYSNTDFFYAEVINLAEKLVGISPGSFDKKVYFGNSGAESVEAASKLAKWHTRKQRFIGFISAFHGRTVGALSFTASKPTQRRYFFPLMPGVTHVPYPYCYRCPFKQTYPDCNYWCIDFIDEFVLQKYVPPEEVAAILFEPIQGEGGYVVPPPEYFQRLKKLADKYGILLIDDEVQAGTGRTGKWFAIEHWGVEPDILCSAKALASGLPLGATIAKAKVMDWVGGSHASTFGGNPLSCVAANAVIDVIRDEGLLENATRQGAYIMKRLEELKGQTEIVGDVRGKGLMIGMEIVEDKETKKPAPNKAKEIMVRSWRRGIAVITCGASTIRIAPPLSITRELVDSALEIIEDVVEDVGKEG